MPKLIPVASSLRHFYNSIMGDIRSLESLEIDVVACAPFLVPIIEDKLPFKVLSSIGDCGRQCSFDLKGFIDKFREYITRQEQAVNRPTGQQTSFETYEPLSTFSTLSASVTTCCQLCKGPHAAQRCPQPTADKTAAVVNNKLCLNCLYSGHRVSQCNAKGRCAKCKGKHHTAIHGIQIHRSANIASPSRNNNSTRQPPSQANTHFAVVSNQPPTPPSASNSTSTAHPSQHTVSNCAFALKRPALLNVDFGSDNNNIDSLKPVYSSDVDTHVITRKDTLINSGNGSISQKHFTPENETVTNVANTILLKTAKAVAVSADKKVTARICFDEGSQRSYACTEFASALDLIPTSYEPLSVSRFGGNITEHSYGVTNIGLETPTGIKNVRVLIIDEIVQPLQHYDFDNIKSHPRLQNLPLANDFKDSSFVVDILLGADAAYRFLGNVSTECTHPLIQESQFGYVLSGPISHNQKPICESTPKNHDLSTNAINSPFTDSEIRQNESTVSFENLMNNSSLFIQIDRLFQDQFVSDTSTNTQMNEFLHSYRQQIEFRNGFYYEPLPWKPDHPPLPSNLSLCKKRLQQVTFRLNKLGLMET